MYFINILIIFLFIFLFGSGKKIAVDTSVNDVDKKIREDKRKNKERKRIKWIFVLLNN